MAHDAGPVAKRVGDRVRTNSEAFAAILHPPGTDVTEGATISSHFYPGRDDPRHEQPVPAQLRLHEVGTVAGDRWGRRHGPAPPDSSPLLRHPMSATANARATDWHRRTTILTVMQHAENEMALRLTRTLGRWRLRSELPPDAAPIPGLPAAGRCGGVAVAAASGGRAYSTVLESLLGWAPRPTSWAVR